MRTGCVALAVTVSVAFSVPTAFDEIGRAAGDLLFVALTDDALGLTLLALIGFVAAALVAVVGIVELPLVMVELPCSSGGSVVVVTTAPT